MKGRKWIRFKKDLPNNWRILIAESLEKKGVVLTIDQISKIRSGTLTNPDWQLLVWQEINELKKHSTHIKSKIVALQKLE